MKLATAVAALAALLGAAPTTAATAVPAGRTSANPVLGVHGNKLLSHGRAVRLIGVQPQGLESNCLSPGLSYFEGPHNQKAVDAIKGWGANTVRIPINSSCWLGDVRGTGAPYRKAVVRWVKLFRANGVFVVIDNHTATDGTIPADNLPMPDMRAVALWHSIGKAFTSTSGVVFDLYNEPHLVSWSCWRDGCQIPAGADPVRHGAYRTPGLQALVDALRSTGANQPILLGGLDWSNDNHRWARYAPHDPLHQLIVSEHVYGPSPTNDAAPCGASCKADLLRLAKAHPVVFGELGEVDCKHGYVDRFMAWADHHHIGYIGGAWNAIRPGSYQCESPALLQNYDYPDPRPSRYGIGFRTHMRKLAGLPVG
ncbi:MAG TPA: cellulase family glycosylhydrolase [Mycobacteriales bacterium]|jgi:hypothetical protein|nr:cellulase family glycosylhydrolase [Mycobacteriales bacterium]